VEIKMKFHFNSPNLFLNGVALAGRLMEGDVKLRFHLCQLRLNETVYRNLSVQRHNDKQMATYPTVRSKIRTFSIQGNLTRFDIPNLFQNRVPDRLMVALVDSRNFNGDVTRDPFCFQKFGLSSIRQIVRGEEYPYETLHLAHDNATRDNLGYFCFLQASGAWCKKKGNMVELGDWGDDKNCTLFMFDNVANGCADSQRLNPKQTGDLQLSLAFGAAPNTNITVLVYGEFENLLEIDSNGAKYVDTKYVVAPIINVVVNKKMEKEPLVCHFLSDGHANGQIVSLSYPFQYFGRGSFGMWQNRVYGKTLVREQGLV